MRKTILASMLLAVAFVAGGCISNTKYGNDSTEVVGQGASEGDVIAKHGCPDNIVYLGTAYFNPTTGERGAIDKYIFEYRIGGGSTLLAKAGGGGSGISGILGNNKFSNIAYLISNGKVLGGGNVGEGSGSALLGGDFLHPKVRAGYGGDGTPSGAPLNLPKKPGLFGLGLGPL